MPYSELIKDVQHIQVYIREFYVYLEKICDNVGSIFVTDGTDLLTQLTKILKGS